MALIDISNLSFAHDNGQVVFSRVSLQLDTDWKLGLIGRNGRGKTTFLKLLCGEYAFEGSIRTPVAMSYFPFAVADPGQTGREVAAGLCPGLEPWELEREAALLEFAPEALERPFATLSGGEGTKLLLAALFLRGNNFLLIDEPTNHLDMRSREVVGKYLKGKRGFILVSHDRAFLDDCVDHVLSINRADIELQRGNFSSWQHNRRLQDEYEQAQAGRLKKEMARLAEAAQKSAAWSREAEKGKYGNGPVDRGFIGHKAAKMMKRSKAVEARRQKAVADKAQLLGNVEDAAPVSMRPLVFQGARLAELRDVTVSYDGREVVRNVSFSLGRGERLALHGKNGSGKSSILKLFTEERPEFTGTLYLAGGLKVSYVPQDASFVRGQVADFARERGVDANLLLAVLHRLGFERGKFGADMAAYSAGQKKKVLLGASLCAEAHLYIWDEPLNYIDVISRMQVEELILQYAPTMILVEHDRVFLDMVATRVLDI